MLLLKTLTFRDFGYVVEM